MKNLLLVGVSVFVLAACGAEEQTAEESSGDTTEQVESSVAASEATTNDKGTRSTPYALSDPIEMKVSYTDTDSDTFESVDGKLKVIFNNATKGQEAQDLLISENQYNDQAPEGYQWMILDTTAELLEGSEDFEYNIYLTEEVYDGSGASVDNMMASAYINNQLSDQSIFPGATAQGNIVLLVPENLEGALMKLSNLGGGDAVWVDLNS